MGSTDGTVHEDNRCHTTTCLTAQATYVWCNNKVHLCSHCCHGKAISITHYEWVCVCVCAHARMCVALVIKHAKHMHHIILSSVACLALSHFFTVSHKWPIYQISWKYVQWELSCSMQTNWHTDTMRLTATSFNFASVTKNCTFHQHSKLHACCFIIWNTGIRFLVSLKFLTLTKML